VPVLSIHDLGLNPLPSDVVIDGSLRPLVQNFMGSETEFYTGTEYMIVSPPYGVLRERPKIFREKIETVFISLGGGDSGGHFSKILEGLRLSGRRIDVVGVRGFTPWGQDDLGRLKWHPIRFRWAGENELIPDLLFGSDLAITAGGITAFEALCAGTPLLALSHDAFQEITVERLGVANACIDLGRGDLLKPFEIPPILKIVEEDRSGRERMSQRGREMVDGRGAERIAEIVRRSVDNRRREIRRGRECSTR
jgi:UDP-2,4-diacetamido-2,4,6-trideoxy-beta-L-altropyranose hydrolase